MDEHAFLGNGITAGLKITTGNAAEPGRMVWLMAGPIPQPSPSPAPPAPSPGPGPVEPPPPPTPNPPGARGDVLRDHAQHRHDDIPRLDCPACRKFARHRKR
jgi:hypothetical protein